MDRLEKWGESLLLGIASNALFQALLASGVVTAMSAVATAIAARFHLVSPVWENLASGALAGIILLGILIVLFSYLRLPSLFQTKRFDVLIPLPNVRTASQWNELAMHMNEATNRKYEYQELLLDGTHFRNCSFNRLRLYYDGTAPMAFTDCEFDEDTRRGINSHSPLIAQWMEVLKELGLLREGIRSAILPIEDAKRTVQTPVAASDDKRN